MTDIIVKNGKCAGILAKTADGEEMKIYAIGYDFASGGIGGRYQHSTNFPHLTGDALDISREAWNLSGASGLCPDPPDNVVFFKTGAKISDFRICPWRRRSSL